MQHTRRLVLYLACILVVFAQIGCSQSNSYQITVKASREDLRQRLDRQLLQSVPAVRAPDTRISRKDSDELRWSESLPETFLADHQRVCVISFRSIPTRPNETEIWLCLERQKRGRFAKPTDWESVKPEGSDFEWNEFKLLHAFVLKEDDAGATFFEKVIRKSSVGDTQ